VRLLELAQRGFAPNCTIADFAKGLRSGQEQALPDVPCWGDVFQGLYEIEPVVRHLESRTYDAMTAAEKLAQQQKRHEWRKGRKDREVSGKLPHARKAKSKAIALADDVATLCCWLQRDILAVAGPDHTTRCELLDFVVAELSSAKSSASSGFARSAFCWRTKGTCSWPLPSNWTRISRRWPSSGKSARQRFAK
jgi:hypothetical protein